MSTHTLNRLERKTCPYCGGAGYHQLLLGGTETCGHCKGTGKQPEKLFKG